MLTWCFVLVACCIAYSQQVPIDDEVLRVKKDIESQKSNEKFNNSGIADNMMSMEKQRIAYYPVQGGYGYHNIGQMVHPLPHYPTGWPMQQYQNQLPSGVSYQRELSENPTARTLGHAGLRPSLYSQYQTAPQVYAISNSYVQQPYEYSTPYYSSHYSGSYLPYYRDAGEEEKPRQFLSYGTSDKIISPVQPSVYYATKYLMEKPTAINTMPYTQPMTQMTPMFIRSTGNEAELMNLQGRNAGEENTDGVSYKVIPSTFGYPSLNELRGRNIFVDDKLQMQIPPNYLMDRLQHLTPSDIVQQPQPQQFSRAAEESTPSEWQQSSFIQNPVYKNSNPQNQDPYVTPEDQVIMEPFFLPEQGQAAHAARAAEQGMLYGYPTYPNLRQQMRNAQMQMLYNNMNNNAADIETLAREYAKERGWLSDAKETAKSSESSEVKEVLKQLFSKMKSVEEKPEGKMEIKESKKDEVKTIKDMKKDQGTTEAKSNDPNVGAVFASQPNSGRGM